MNVMGKRGIAIEAHIPLMKSADHSMRGLVACEASLPLGRNSDQSQTQATTSHDGSSLVTTLPGGSSLVMIEHY